ncbi:phage protein NinX family protein [Serratia silvae]|uniref:DUF2591 family protein n=1 Tax=Serratia silvae TaxID=2824122 RepID=A0ABT0KH39_9GAMM|nr:phage protein NinX family protein [Serratia silvae]MCL1031335.1 DUF2591 family protein [Serratia silvae]
MIKFSELDELGLSKVPDFEINKRVAESLGYIARIAPHYPESVELWRFETTFYDKGNKYQGNADYCNNAEQAWPIIAENKISLVPYRFNGGFWEAHDKYGTGRSVPDKKPLRAAMIVYLIAQEQRA